MDTEKNAQNGSGRGTVMVFLLTGLVLVLAGIFIPQEWAPDIRRTEVLTGAVFVIGAVAALLLA